MSWLFSRALVEAFLQAESLAGGRSAPLKSTGTEGAFLTYDSPTDAWRASQYGTTSEPLTDSPGEGVLTWFLEGFPARRIPQQLEDALRRTTSGRKCGESWQRQLPGTFLPKTSRELQSNKRRKTFVTWVTKPAAFPLERKTWVVTTHGPDIGYVHTPTATANYHAPSMQKHPNCRAFVTVFGAPSPSAHEYLMGWPTGWSALEPLEMGKFRSWLQQHGDFSQVNDAL